ncbi:MAG TPA: hypothetical protein VK193_00825 [Methyloceanibacter sp.]|nr:hypothetical protein [Methyloceanibacter sp.]
MLKHLVSRARSSPRLVLAIVAMLAAMALASVGRSEQALMWTEQEDGGLTMLSYGPLDPAQNPLFVLSCFSGMNIVVLDVHKEIPDAKPGDPLTIELSSAKAQSPLKGEVGKNETTSKTFGEASDINVKPMLEVLRDSGPLTIKMGGANATMSEQGRAESVSKFVENCKLE